MSNVHPPLAIFRGLKRTGIDFAACMPCVNLQALLRLISEDPDFIQIPVTLEEEGAGICAGEWMCGHQYLVPSPSGRGC